MERVRYKDKTTTRLQISTIREAKNTNHRVHFKNCITLDIFTAR